MKSILVVGKETHAFQIIQSDSLELFRTNSSAMDKVFKQIGSVAPTKSTVLLTGETGTGKSVLAQLIHKQSSRKDKQFISVHCGAIPDTLIESEMFGHEKGAFTSAVRRKMGKFQTASGGTIFLDEIGTILFETETTSVVLPSSEHLTLAEARQHGIEEIERNYLKDILARNKGKINASARDAGISSRQLNKLMNKYGLRKEEFK